MSELLNKNPLRELRERLGMSRIEFARALGVSKQTLVEFELGGRPTITSKIANGLQNIGQDPQLLASKYNEWYQELWQHYLHLARERGCGDV